MLSINDLSPIKLIERDCGFATLVQTSEYIRDMKTAGKRKPWMRDEAYPNDEIVVG